MQVLDVVDVVDVPVRMSQLKLVVGQHVHGVGRWAECLSQHQQARGVLPVVRRRPPHDPAEGQELPGNGVDLLVAIGTI